MAKRATKRTRRSAAREDFNIDLINEDIRAREQGPQKRKTFHLKDLKMVRPKTQTQEEVFHLWNDETKSAIVLSNQAGCGKTFLSMYLGLRDVLDPDSPYEKIIIIRSAVQGREIGHLPGTEQEKLQAYEAPYIAICDELFPWKKSYENLKELGKIEFQSTSFLRGQTFCDSIVIVDEMQNMNYEELSTAISRIHESSRIVFCGDMNQNDLHRKRNDESGLGNFMKIMESMNEVGIVRFGLDDIVRGGLVKSFLTAASKFGF